MKLSVYLCSRVRHESRPFNNQVARSLEPFFDVYIPHDQKVNNPGPEERFDVDKIFELDFAALSTADIVVVCGGDVGKDCAWEIGFAYAWGVPIYFVENGAADWLSSPMLIPALKSNPPIKNPDQAGESILAWEFVRGNE